MEKVTIHLASGEALEALIDPEEDFQLEAQRLIEVRARMNREHKTIPPHLQRDPADSEAYVESCLSNPREPHWIWVGDTFLYSQAVAAVEFHGDV